MKNLFQRFQSQVDTSATPTPPPGTPPRQAATVSEPVSVTVSDTSPATTPDTAGHSQPQPPSTNTATTEQGRGESIETASAPQTRVSEPLAAETVVSGTPGDVAGYMTLDEVANAFKTAGVERARRSLQRYCENGLLIATKFDTESGPQYFVKAQSVQPAIDAVKELELSRTRRDAVHKDTITTTPAMELAANQNTTQPSSTPAPDTNPVMERYVSRLEHDLELAEKENKTKNDLITSLLDRNRETNVLMQDMHRMLATTLPLAKAPRHRLVEKSPSEKSKPAQLSDAQSPTSDTAADESGEDDIGDIG